MLAGAGDKQFATGGNDIGREQIIAAQAHFPANQPRPPGPMTAIPVSETEPWWPGRRPVFRDRILPGHPAFGSRWPSDRIDPDAAMRQVDHQAAIAYRIAGDIMATTTHRYQELMGTGEVNCADDIGDPGCRAMSPGRLSIMPFQTLRASS